MIVVIINENLLWLCLYIKLYMETLPIVAQHREFCTQFLLATSLIFLALDIYYDCVYIWIYIYIYMYIIWGKT